jgi:hypothetical protein
MRQSAPKKLRWKQELGLLYLLSSPSVEEAARASGISDATLWRWLADPVFDRRYRELRRGAVKVATARLQELSGLAAQTLAEIMASAAATPASRVAAARTVLEMSLRSVELEEIESRLAALEKAIESMHGRPARVA